MSFTCDNCGEKVGRAAGADSHEYRCPKPDPPLCAKKCPSGYVPDCGYNRGHHGVCEGQYDADLVRKINQDRME